MCGGLQYLTATDSRSPCTGLKREFCKVVSIFSFFVFMWNLEHLIRFVCFRENKWYNQSICFHLNFYGETDAWMGQNKILPQYVNKIEFL